MPFYKPVLAQNLRYLLYHITIRGGLLMNAKKVFRTIETHTLGQPTRNIVGEDSPACPAKRWQKNSFI